MDPRVQKMSDVLVNYSVGIRSGDWVVISTSPLGEPLADACVSAILKAGGNPSVTFRSDDVAETILSEASEEQLSFISPIGRVVYEQADATIGIIAPANTRALAGVDPVRLGIQAKASEALLETFMRRSASGELRWTGAAYPTLAGAQDAGMSLRDYEDFVYGAGLLNEPDPVAAWKQLGQGQQKLVDWLSDKREVHIAGPGTDLTVGIGGRVWINDDGQKNFPGGEVFTGPVENATEGVIQFNYPGYLQGREVTGVRLRFERGVVVEATASSEEEFLKQMLDVDEGARRLGEFAFGTNPGIQRPTKNVLFDEKIGGTLHMALGRAYPDTGGTNVSALHWDIVYNLREGAEVTVDGQIFSRDGEFTI